MTAARRAALGRGERQTWRLVTKKIMVSILAASVLLVDFAAITHVAVHSRFLGRCPRRDKPRATWRSTR